MEKLSLSKKDIIKFSALLGLLVFAWISVDYFNLRGLVTSFTERSHTPENVFIFLVLYVVLIIALLPSAPLNILAGAVFGPIVVTIYS